MSTYSICYCNKCKHYWECLCMYSIQKGAIDVNEEGRCATFEPGINEQYLNKENNND